MTVDIDADLNSVVITFASVCLDDQGQPYAETNVARLDFQGTFSNLLDILKQHPEFIVHVEQLVADENKDDDC